VGQIGQGLVDLSSAKPFLEAGAAHCKISTTVEDVRLTIDAISLNVDLPAEMVARIDGFINQFTSQGASKYKNSFHRHYDRNYRTGFRAYLNDLLAWEPTGASTFVCQTGSKRPGSKNTRFAWNPSKCDSATVAGIIFNDYLDIPPTCMMGATVSGIHLAADIPNAEVDDQAFSYPQMRRSENKFSSGRTMYLGVKSGKTRIVAYDKREEIIAANGKLGTFLAGIKEPVPPHYLLRIEVQLKPSSIHDHASSMGLPELNDLPNPFAKLRLHAVPTNLTRDERLALTVARYEGLRRALHLANFTPAEEKSFLRKLKKAGMPNWWKPQHIWEKQFPPLVQEFLTPFTPTLCGTMVPGDKFDPPLIQHVAEGMTA
jgi:hypothetical protein